MKEETNINMIQELITEKKTILFLESKGQDNEMVHKQQMLERTEKEKNGALT